VPEPTCTLLPPERCNSGFAYAATAFGITVAVAAVLIAVAVPAHLGKAAAHQLLPVCADAKEITAPLLSSSSATSESSNVGNAQAY
jgi:hypothetical protein